MAKEDAQAKISEEILTDARTKAERILKAARREVEKMTKTAQDEARQTEKETMEEADKRADALTRVIRASTEPAMRRIQLDVREKVLLDIISEARKALLNRDSQDYPQMLAALTAEAAELLGGGQLVAHISRQDFDRFGDDLSQRLQARDPGATIEVRFAEDIEWGVIVRTVDGTRQVDNTIDARLQRIYPVLRRNVADTLFG